MHYRSMITLLAFFTAACTDLTAIQNFAKNSSVVSSNTTILNGSEAAFGSLKLYADALNAHYPGARLIPAEYSELIADGPGTPAFDDAKKNAPLIAQTLQRYMQIIGQLAGDTTVVTTGDVSGVAASLKGLSVTDPKAAVGLDGAEQVANLLAQGIVQARLGKIIEAADPGVQKITTFLSAFASQNARLYDAARAYSLLYWREVGGQCAATPASRHVTPGGACAAIGPLSIHAYRQEEVGLNRAIKSADDAAIAFTKIGSDHSALAGAKGKLDAREIIKQLQADEPALLAAVKDIEKL